MRYEEYTLEGRNAVLEAFRAGKTIDKLYIQDGCHDGIINTITREARKTDTIISYVAKERMDQMSTTGSHQGVIAQGAWRYHSETACRRLDGNCCQGVRRRVELYAGRESDKYVPDHQRIKAKGNVVCVCRYGGRNHV